MSCTGIRTTFESLVTVRFCGLFIDISEISYAF